MTLPMGVDETTDVPEIELPGITSPLDSRRVQPSFDSLVADQERADFDAQTYLRPSIPLPVPGWRARLQQVTFGLVKPGPRPRQQYEAGMVERIRARALSSRKIAFASAKGGVGKTT